MDEKPEARKRGRQRAREAEGPEVQVNVRLPLETVRSLKVFGVMNNVTLTTIIRDAIDLWFQRQAIEAEQQAFDAARDAARDDENIPPEYR